ncbi:YlzJ-like family protein [Cytobacillus suaedae]|nr:YlzJ-like family protein [Cytobacillus suaedae]
MILYTMMPEELVFPTNENDFGKQRYVEHNGVSMLVNEISPQCCEIVRIVSTDPQHYLDAQYSPGQRLMVSFS